LLMALLIKLESPGPAFYVQQRIGRNAEVFQLYKLRSMSHEPVGRRVTRTGRFLRLTMLEEYPQFYNVLRGDMTLFGPRPLSPERDGHLAVKPGFVPWFSH
ncbi:MAG TPA: sugar transferase, partial [Oceanobacillus sp.]|nr:sugar transferase [Oceanobacillus sp.]